MGGTYSRSHDMWEGLAVGHMTGGRCCSRLHDRWEGFAEVTGGRDLQRSCDRWEGFIAGVCQG